MVVVTRPVGPDMWRGAHPVAADGRRCQYAVRTHGGDDALYTPTPGEMLQYLFAPTLGADYLPASPTQRLSARFLLAARLAETLQKRWSSRGITVRVAASPATTEPFEPNVLWLRPQQEWDFVLSLVDAGRLAAASARLTTTASPRDLATTG